MRRFRARSLERPVSQAEIVRGRGDSRSSRPPKTQIPGGDDSEPRQLREAAPIGSSDIPVRHTTAKRKIAVPEKTPSAATDMATARAWEAPMPEPMRAPAPAPICVAAPALGDMGEMRKVLNKAITANHVVARGKVRLWVTEFSWDSKPPDPKGVPIALETRWVSQMLYQMWSSGVSLVNWSWSCPDLIDTSA